MPLINFKIHLELNWNNNCVMYGPDTYASGDNTNDRETTFKITSTKLYVPIVTLSTKDNYQLDYQYFKDHSQLIAVDLCKQKELDADPRALQQIEFYGMLKTNSQVCTVLEKSK